MADTAARARGGRSGVILIPLGLLVAAMVSMQVGAAFAKGLFPKVGPQGATALRLGFSALILAAARRPWRSLRLGEAALPLVAYGLSLGAMNTLFYMALRTVPLGIAIALEFTGPLTVAVLGSRRWVDALWIGLTLAGLWMLLPLGRSVRNVDPTGALLALASGAFWALYIVFGRRVGGAFGSKGVALGMIIAASVFAPVGLISVGPKILDPTLLASGVLLALLSSAVPYTLEMAALTRIPARAFGALMSLEPVVGALAGWLVLSEVPSGVQWAGIGAIILASLGTTLTTNVETKTLPI